jgi:hypothetical protein
MDVGQAQAEIDKYVAEQRSRKRVRSFTYAVMSLIVLGIFGFFSFKGSLREKHKEQIAGFFNEFRKVDDGATAAFWQCTVRTRTKDVHLANDAAEITEGLTKAFENYPKGQPDLLLKKCIPMIDGILADVKKLQPPAGFATPLAVYSEVMAEVKNTFTTYANTISQRKEEASVEQEIRNAHKDFHSVLANGGGWAPVQDTPKAMEYFNIMQCLIPDLVSLARKIKNPPDSQPIVDLYFKCKADAGFANKIRRECYAQRNQTSMRSKEFKLVASKMSGDDRDLNTINYCFTKANTGFAFEELKAVAVVFGKYRNQARGNILKVMSDYKKEFGE